MAKKSAIERNNKRIKTAEKFAKKRADIKEKMRKATGEERMLLQNDLNKMPRNACPIRVRNRCELTGRPRGYYRKFHMSRNMLRHYAMFGEIPGVVKSSW